MSQSNIQHITLSPGEKRELVFLNEPNVDWHITQQEGSSLLLHVIALIQSLQLPNNKLPSPWNMRQKAAVLRSMAWDC